MSAPVGRALDALVAEKVMRLDGVGYYKRESCRNRRWVPAVKDEVTEDCPAWNASLYYLPGASEYGPDTALALSATLSPRAIPLYSTDIAAAWLVVEKLLDWRITISGGEYHGDMWHVHICHAVNFETGKGCDAHIGDGITATLPEAICRAALATVGVEDEEV